MDVYICIIIILCASVSSTETQSCKREARCKISKIHSMKAADCYNKDMTTLSHCLPRDIEIMDLSHNRIRKITREDLKKYPDLKMLYLNDNLIGNIDNKSFEEMHYLHTLDLSLNAIANLPSMLFQLPSLKSLYLGQNNVNMHIVESVKEAKPVTSPLYNLDISYIASEEASELPDFGLMSTLEKYNISGNKLLSVTTKNFAGLCSLKALDTTNVSIEHENQICDCWTVNHWLQNRKVSFKPFECRNAEAECMKDNVSSDDLMLYNQCQEEITKSLRQAKVKTILLIVMPISVVVISGTLLFVFIRIRRRRRTKQKHKQKSVDNTQRLILNDAETRKMLQ